MVYTTQGRPMLQIDHTTQIRVLGADQLQDNELVSVNDHYSNRLIQRGDLVVCVKPTPGLQVGDVVRLLRIFEVSTGEYEIEEDEDDDIIVGEGIKVQSHVSVDGEVINMVSGLPRAESEVEISVDSLPRHGIRFPLQNVSLKSSVIAQALTTGIKDSFL